MRSYGPFIVGIGRKRKCRIGKCENRAAIGDAETVDHRRQHGHRDLSVPGLDRQPLEAKGSRRIVLSPQEIRACQRQLTRRNGCLITHRELLEYLFTRNAEVERTLPKGRTNIPASSQIRWSLNAM